jgi:hypothetical protein
MQKELKVLITLFILLGTGFLATFLSIDKQTPCEDLETPVRASGDVLHKGYYYHTETILYRDCDR